MRRRCTTALVVLLLGCMGPAGCADSDRGKRIFRVVPVADVERVGPGLREAYQQFESRRPNRQLVQVLELVGALSFVEGDLVRVPLPDGEEAQAEIRQIRCGLYARRPATCVWSARNDDHSTSMSFSYRRDRLGGLIYDTEVSASIRHFQEAYQIQTISGYQFMYRTGTGANAISGG